MRKHKISSLDFEVDLDDPKTYDHLPKKISKLRKIMFYEIGFAFCYMNFRYKELFENQAKAQKDRVQLLVNNFMENEFNNRENVLWHQEQIFLFQDEIENMC